MAEAQLEKNVSEKPKKYIRKDTKGGFLFNESEIRYYNQIEQIDVFDNLLLGDWAKNGEYKIDDNIKKELLNVPKYYTSAFGDNMFCETYIDIDDFGKLEFAVKIQNNAPKQGYMTATLIVLEKIDRANGYYQNTNSGVVETYTALDAPSFVTDCFAKFHIYQKKEDGLLDKEIPDVAEIVARKRELYKQKAKLMPKLDGYFKKVVDKKMKALKGSKVGKEIVDKFYGEGATITGFFIKEGMPGYSRYLNQMLDGVLDTYSEKVLSDVKLKASINEANNAFVNDLNNGNKQRVQVQQQTKVNTRENVEEK